jgi:hypothetical protein
MTPNLFPLPERVFRSTSARAGPVAVVALRAFGERRALLPSAGGRQPCPRSDAELMWEAS